MDTNQLFNFMLEMLKSQKAFPVAPGFSSGVMITSMILAALAPLIAVVVTRLKTAAELKEIHTAVNSLATAKDAKVEALEKRLEVQGEAILRLTGERATQDQKLLESEKKAHGAATGPVTAAADPKTIITEKIVTNQIVKNPS